jgi:endonuclease YncB( thermonuclease family)
MSGPSGDPAGGVPGGAELVTVVSITDGDTIEVEHDDGSLSEVRLIGIDSPEQGECFSDVSARVLTTLAGPGARIGMTADVSETDRFGRLLRYLWLGAMSVNEESVRRGAAISRRYPPDTALAERFDAAQTAAKQQELGLWAPDACGPASPGRLSIASIVFDPPGDDSLVLNEEWVQIRNDGPKLVDLTGWGIKDESASNRYRFPESFTLGPGELATVHSGCGDDSGTDLFWCSAGAAIWNNDGDTVFLLDPSGNIHTSKPYAGTTASATVTSVQRFAGGGGDCDPSYPDVCIPPYPPDLDCGDVPYTDIRVIGSDPHGFDGNHDGVGCES